MTRCIIIFFLICTIQAQTSVDDDIQVIYNKMREVNKANQKKVIPPVLDFKLVTINLGMLSHPFASVPWYDERSSALPHIMETFIKEEQPSIIFVQELWKYTDFFNLNEMALANGYLPLIDDYNQGHVKKRGMQILLNSSIFDDSSFSRPGFWRYKTDKKEKIGAWYENLFSYERGVLYTKANLPGGLQLLLANTHLTPNNFGLQFQIRKDQLDSIFDFIRMEGDTHYLFLGGDFNLSPEFSSSKEWQSWMKYNLETPSKVKPVNHLLQQRYKWQKNKELYLYFYNMANENDLFLFDTYATVKTDLDFTYSHINLTVDKNFFSRNIPNQRLDYIWTASLKSNYLLVVLNSKLALDRPEIFIDRKENSFFSTQSTNEKPLAITISDHFAVISMVRIFRGDR